MSVRLPLNMSEHQCVCVYERMCVCACVYVSGVRVCVNVLMCILICIVFRLLPCSLYGCRVGASSGLFCLPPPAISMSYISLHCFSIFVLFFLFLSA